MEPLDLATTRQGGVRRCSQQGKGYTDKITTGVRDHNTLKGPGSIHNKLKGSRQHAQKAKGIQAVFTTS